MSTIKFTVIKFITPDTINEEEYKNLKDKITKNVNIELIENNYIFHLFEGTWAMVLVTILIPTFYYLHEVFQFEIFQVYLFSCSTAFVMLAIFFLLEGPSRIFANIDKKTYYNKFKFAIHQSDSYEEFLKYELFLKRYNNNNKNELNNQFNFWYKKNLKKSWKNYTKEFFQSAKKHILSEDGYYSMMLSIVAFTLVSVGYLIYWLYNYFIG